MRERLSVRFVTIAALVTAIAFVAWPVPDILAQAGARERTIFVSAVAVALPSAQVSIVHCTVVGLQNLPVRSEVLTLVAIS